MAEIPVNLCFFGWILWWQIWQRTCCFEVRMHCLCVQDMINASTAKTSSKWHKMTYRRPTNNTSDLALSACVIHELRWGDKVEGSARGVGNFKGYLFQGRHVQHLLYQKKKIPLNFVLSDSCLLQPPRHDATVLYLSARIKVLQGRRPECSITKPTFAMWCT